MSFERWMWTVFAAMIVIMAALAGNILFPGLLYWLAKWWCITTIAMAGVMAIAIVFFEPPTRR